MLFLYLYMLDTEEEKDKFTRIYEDYRQFMFYVANKVLRDEGLAEDALQESFLRVVNNLHKIDESDVPKTKGFLKIIVKNVAVTMLLKVSKEVPDEDFQEGLLDEAFLPEVEAEKRDMRNHLIAAIARLKPEHQEILELVYFHDLKIANAATICGITPVTARKRVQRAKLELRTYLREAGIHEFKV